MMQEKPDAKTNLVQGRYRTLLVIWVAILWSIVIMVAVPVMVKSQAELSSNNKLFWVFAGMCLLMVVASFVLKGVLLSRAGREQNLAGAATAYIISFALCEGSCVLALVAYFTGVSRYYYLLFAPGILCMLFHMPHRGRLLAATYKEQG